MAAGLLMLLDDITTILDDVALLTKVAAKQTAGVLGDDLTLNAQQVTGVAANRELPVVWAVAKGSLVNKAILVPAALLLSAVLPWTIKPLLMIGGAFLCYEGCEKLAHKFFHPAEEKEHRDNVHRANADPKVDLVKLEKSKISGAIRTDFILSAEIVVITLGSVAEETFIKRLLVLVAIALLMTVGVYGLVAGIVKLDDLGAKLLATPSDAFLVTIRKKIGHAILSLAPYLMKFLSIAGTAAMFLVGGGILAHGVPPIHHFIETLEHHAQSVTSFGATLGSLTVMLANAVVGILIGAIILAVVVCANQIMNRKYSKSTLEH